MTDSFGSFIVTPAAFDVPVANLVPNPSFELDTTGWSILTRDTVAPFAGTHSASTFVPSSTTADIAVSDLIPVSASTVYLLVYYMRNDSGTALHSYSLRWYQADGTTLIGESTPDTVGAQDTLVRGAGHIATSPVDAAFARIHVSQVSAPFANTGTVDAFMLTQGSTLYDYFDGDTADTAQFTYEWTRAAHNSASIRTAVT